MTEYPKFNLNALNPIYLKKYIDESVESGTLEWVFNDIRQILKMLESPEYRNHNPEYTKEDIQILVSKFTLIFKILICEREMLNKK